MFQYEGEVYKKAPQGYGVAYYEHSRGLTAGVGGWINMKDTVTISGTWHKGLRHGVCKYLNYILDIVSNTHITGIEKRQYWEERERVVEVQEYNHGLKHGRGKTFVKHINKYEKNNFVMYDKDKEIENKTPLIYYSRDGSLNDYTERTIKELRMFEKFVSDKKKSQL